MRDHLTLKSTHPPDQATDPGDRPTRTPGKRQPQELQTAFLDGILNQPVTVYLVNGIRLTGKVRQHDPFTLQLQDADGIDSLIFKHAISTVIPGAPVVTRERRTPFGRRPEWTG
jgi:host factor-I protein